ncbi:pollen-specific leucine-rich repeat extensin-like protein 1, partial [Sceloporus undulatus]|uniref:pollen-specific leucine-rich repeat extensin-like protein 1 n=1 Tax=Sceloporus undulatus TaxID=8520 RepID=UPI001C4CCEC5
MVCVPAGTIPSTTSDVARGSKPPSATDPSKRRHKSSGTEGTEPASKLMRRSEGSHSKKATKPEAHLASPSSSKASKPSRHAPKPKELAVPSEGARSPRPSSSAAAAVLLDLPDNPFFPAEEVPRPGKKRHHDKSGRDPAPKKSKSSKDRPTTDPPKTKDKKRSPSKQARASTSAAPRDPEPAPGGRWTPVPDTPPPQPTMDFVHGTEDTVLPLSLEHRSPSHSGTDNDEDQPHRQGIPDLFLDTQSGRYYLSISEDRAMKEFTRLNPHPADHGTSSRSVPTVSVYERSPSPPR